MGLHRLGRVGLDILGISGAMGARCTGTALCGGMSCNARAKWRHVGGSDRLLQLPCVHSLIMFLQGGCLFSGHRAGLVAEHGCVWPWVPWYERADIRLEHPCMVLKLVKSTLVPLLLGKSIRLSDGFASTLESGIMVPGSPDGTQLPE